jgi:phosphatidylglycerophosphatase A
LKSPSNSAPAGPDSAPPPGHIPFIHTLIATGLYSGYSPWASGTAGTAVGLLLYYLIPGMDDPVILGVATVIGFFAGVWSSAVVAAAVGHQLTRTAALAKAKFQAGDNVEHKTADPSIVVIDEIVGMWITLLFLPKTIPVMIIAFFAFRAMDIVKPQPARYLECIPNGWGIMLDDVMAGVYANLLTWGGWWVWQLVFGS